MDDSPLSKLPGEVRNEIYQLALRHTSPIIICKNENEVMAVNSTPAMALTAVCRQMRKETLKIFYAVNSFTIQTEYFNSCYDSMIEDGDDFDPPDVLSSITAWLAHIGIENKNQIPHLCVDLGFFTIEEMYCMSEFYLQFALWEIVSLPLPSTVLHSSIAYEFTEMPFEEVHLTLEFVDFPLANKNTTESIVNAASVAAKENIPINFNRPSHESAIKRLGEKILDTINVVGMQDGLEQLTMDGSAD